MSSFATAEFGVAVTPHNTDPLPYGRARALLFGDAGTVNVQSVDHVPAEVYTIPAAGYTLHISALRVLVTSTTTTNIKALY